MGSRSPHPTPASQLELQALRVVRIELSSRVAVGAAIDGQRVAAIADRGSYDGWTHSMVEHMGSIQSARPLRLSRISAEWALVCTIGYWVLRLHVGDVSWFTILCMYVFILPVFALFRIALRWAMTLIVSARGVESTKP